jgi:hypothetical protein
MNICRQKGRQYLEASGIKVNASIYFGLQEIKKIYKIQHVYGNIFYISTKERKGSEHEGLKDCAL